LDPVMEIDLMPMPESERIFFPSISRDKNSMTLVASGVPCFHSIPAQMSSVFSLKMTALNRSGCFTGEGTPGNQRIGGVKIQLLPESYVQASVSFADGRGKRPLDGDTKLLDGLEGISRQPLLKLLVGFLAGEDLIPHHPSLDSVNVFDSGVENANRRLPDVPPDSVPFNEGNNRTIRDV
jgi:hypothetical protein